MVSCRYCGTDLGGLPFDCNRCGGQYCADCRLPEAHLCAGRDDDTGQSDRWFPKKFERASGSTDRMGLGTPGSGTDVGADAGGRWTTSRAPRLRRNARIRYEQVAGAGYHRFRGVRGGVVRYVLLVSAVIGSLALLLVLLG